MAKAWPIVGVGAVIWRGPDTLLLIRRGQPPRHGEWSIPGGRVEPGETLREALVREIAEETGLTVAVGELINVVELFERDSDGALSHYVLIDFSCQAGAAEAHPASDVTECRWVSPAEAVSCVPWEETRRIIRRSAFLTWGSDI